MQAIFWILILFTAGVLFLLPSLLYRGRTAPRPEPEPTPTVDWESVAAGLSAPLDALRELMAHPQLGGPGFLTVQFPLSGRGTVEVSAQYPNIQETLYQKIIRRTPEAEELIAAGVPAVLFERRAVFTPESGGMVLVTAEAASLPDGAWTLLEDRQGRQAVLWELAQTLGKRYPDMTVRVIGGDLLLTPARSGDEEPYSRHSSKQ